MKRVLLGAAAAAAVAVAGVVVTTKANPPAAPSKFARKHTVMGFGDCSLKSGEPLADFQIHRTIELRGKCEPVADALAKKRGAK